MGEKIFPYINSHTKSFASRLRSKEQTIQETVSNPFSILYLASRKTDSSCQSHVEFKEY